MQMSRWYLGSRLLLIYARRATDNVAIYRQNCFHRTEHLILCFYKQGHVIRINTNALTHGQVNGQLDKNDVMYADIPSCSQTVNQTYRRVD